MPAPKGNQFWKLAENTGRPRTYDDPVAFAKLVQEYFNKCVTHKRRPTLAGISAHLGFYDKESFVYYENAGEEFSRTVRNARLLIEDDRWQQLLDKDRFTVGVIFDLKNNHGWKDKSELDLGVTDDVAEMLDAARKRAKKTDT